jgi:hypothetical protein
VDEGQEAAYKIGFTLGSGPVVITPFS